MMSENHDEWVKYPTGAIDKGEWCGMCKTYNTRKMTTSVIGVRDGEIVLIKRAHDPEKDKWALPGGYGLGGDIEGGGGQRV